jgi:hypothetical protein
MTLVWRSFLDTSLALVATPCAGRGQARVMTRASTLTGKTTQGEKPEWGPLLALVGKDAAGEFMWMFEVERGCFGGSFRMP